VEHKELEGVTGGTVVSRSDFAGDPSAAFITVLLTTGVRKEKNHLVEGSVSLETPPS
jgi:hypothetical protein